ncbi:SLC13 family permease [Allonocardiopsis opalescens]|uniref:UIT1 family transporter n=1 Tax=Allonocardiopsis opalescens TaxID=1144618 RepID=A0A2T0Q0H6_9ACTN|nr:SLC13 family permease [Allonocardiopsis opalescens]PRX97288.1 UIT1 family transporter [Allonocardiopsis opalescens]
MSAEVISILVLIAVFLIATLLPVHMGALALVAAFLVGTLVVGESADEIFAGFPGDLFVILVGVTYLFAIAKDNGTVDWLVRKAVWAVRGRIALIPWVMFAVTSALTAVGAVVPAAVAIIAPMGMGFAARYRINPVLMGLFIINGASAGGFSPISIFGGITNGVVERNGLPGDPGLLFAASYVFNVVLSVVVFFLFGGHRLLGRRELGEHEAAEEPGRTLVAERTVAAVGADAGTAATESGGSGGPARPAAGGGAGGPGGAEPGTGPDAPGPSASQGAAVPAQRSPEPAGERAGADGGEPRLNPIRGLTLAGILALAVGALFFGIDVGFMAITVAVVLALVSPKSTKGAVSGVAWPTVLLICGIVTYVSLMERMGTVTFLGDSVASIGAPLLAALIICVIGGAVSAFASTTGILGALIPLAVPFLLGGDIGAVGLITALALSSSVVDSSPFSTSGALVVANAGDAEREQVFKRLMAWGFSMIAIAPLVTWLVLVVPGWL